MPLDSWFTLQRFEETDMKYIDADHLKVEIEKHIKEVKDAEKRFTPNMGFFDAKLSGIYDVIAIIDSLQQEQPEVDLVANLKHHLATTPKEQLEKEWKELEPWNNIGPTVQEFLYGKQQEVDLKKEYKEYVEDDPVFSILTNRNVGLAIASHFYELGKNSK